MSKSRFDDPDAVAQWIAKSFGYMVSYVALRDPAFAFEALSAAAKLIDGQTAGAPLSEGDRDAVLQIFHDMAEMLDGGPKGGEG